MKKIIFIFLQLILLNILFAQTEDTLYYSNPNYHVAKELFNRKIVMLGDCGHPFISFYKRLADVLNNWLSICREDKQTIKLTLVIEDDEQHVSLINKYLLSGDLKPVYDLISPGISFRDLEGYTMLLNFYKNLLSENNNRENKLSFKIAGFEQTNESNYLNNLSRLSKKESELWFINFRDSVIANNLINYIQQNPEEQILIFYGGDHLRNGLVNKNLGFKDISDEESMGHYLAYYLKREFGNSAAATFTPNYYRANLNPLFRNSLLELIRNEEFIFKPKELINLIYNDTVFDYIINVHDIGVPSFYGNYICSKFIFEKTVEKINIIKNSLPGYKAANDYKGYLKSAKLVTGIEFENDTALNDWASKNTYDGINWLYNNGLTDTLKKLFLTNRDIKFINRYLNLYCVSSIPDSMNYYRWILNEMPWVLNQIKFTNSIGIYWLGYPDENVKAKEYLVQFSGEDFAEPEKYLQWYRMKYFGYEY